MGVQALRVLTLASWAPDAAGLNSSLGTELGQLVLCTYWSLSGMIGQLLEGGQGEGLCAWYTFMCTSVHTRV